MSSFLSTARDYFKKGETETFYNDYASVYENEMSDIGYEGPALCVKIVEKFVKKDASAAFLDVACGTGLAGEELIRKGYANLMLDGVDFSEKSVQICQSKNIYRRAFCGKVGTNRLDVNDGVYDAVLCVGCFIPEHINHECFPELIRITKPGGLIFIQMNIDYLDSGFEEASQTLKQQGIWEEVERHCFDGHFGDSKGLTFVFRVLNDDRNLNVI